MLLTGIGSVKSDIQVPLDDWLIFNGRMKNWYFIASSLEYLPTSSKQENGGIYAGRGTCD